MGCSESKPQKQDGAKPAPAQSPHAGQRGGQEPRNTHQDPTSPTQPDQPQVKEGETFLEAARNEARTRRQSQASPENKKLVPAAAVPKANDDATINPEAWSRAQKQMVALLQFVRNQSRQEKAARQFARWAPYQERFEQFLFIDVLRTLEFADEMDAITSEDGESEASALDLGDIKVETADTRPTDADISTAIDDLMKHRKLPSPDLALYMLQTATDVCLDYDTCHHLSIPEDCRLVVVGDLHGQLDDLLWILKEGLPGPNLMYLFNGDFVDRGSEQIEVLMLLVALKTRYPNKVFMNRGNHEEHRVNKAAGPNGYTQLCIHAYNEDVYKKSHDFFRALPLVTVVAKKIAVMHGGLPADEDITLEEIAQIDRFRECPSSTNRGRTPPVDRGDRIFQSILWSDPKDMQARVKPSVRGAGVFFSEQVTDNFLQTNGLDYIIRSHEVKSQGHYVCHHDKCLTVFSASRYCGKDDNLGSYLVLMPDLAMSVHWYYMRAGQVSSLATKIGKAGAVDPSELIKGMSAVTADILPQLKQAVLTRLGELIFAKRDLLLQLFQQKDPQQTGCVRRAQWVQIMRSEFGGELPWYNLSRHLIMCEPDGTISYPDFLNRFQNGLALQWMNAWSKKFLKYGGYHVLKSNETLKKTLYARKTGKLTYNQLSRELQKSMRSMGMTEIFYLVNYIDTDGDGFVSWSEWEAATSSKVAEGGMPGLVTLWDLQRRDSVAYGGFERELWGKAKSAGDGVKVVKQATFMQMCTKYTGDRDTTMWGTTFAALADSKGYLRSDTLAAAIEELDSDFSRARALMDIIETVTRGQVRFKEMFDALDADASNALSRDEFVRGLQDLGIVEGHDEAARRRAAQSMGRAVNATVVSVADALALYNIIDKNGDQSVTYDEFMAALSVYDTYTFERDVDAEVAHPLGRRWRRRSTVCAFLDDAAAEGSMCTEDTHAQPRAPTPPWRRLRAKVKKPQWLRAPLWMKCGLGQPMTPQSPPVDPDLH